MSVNYRPLRESDALAVAAIFNHYVENGFAAYPEQPMPPASFGKLLAEIGGMPAIVACGEQNGEVMGFAFLRPYNRFSTFSHTAEISCFISPEHLREGLGKELYVRILAQACEKGVKRVLASVCSANQGSLAFHEAMGFLVCGRFEGVMEKKGQVLDVMWFIKGL
jgi:phosphinothricin acetyltransferase